jgi:hypothetical protein
MNLTPAQRKRTYIEQQARVPYPLTNLLRWVIATYVIFSIACENPKSPAEQKGEGCGAFLSRYEPALERMFEVEMHAYHSTMPDPDSDWFKAMVAIGTSAQNARGELRDPADVVREVIQRLAQVKDADSRRHLEYTLLGMAMPLDARKEYEEYCVVASEPAIR